MNIQKQVRKASDLASLKLGGIEVVQALAGSGGTDFAGITIRDTKTGTVLTIQRNPYSDLGIHATFPQKMEKRFIVVSIEETGEFRSKPLKADEIDAVKEAHPGCQVEETEVPVED